MPEIKPYLEIEGLDALAQAIENSMKNPAHESLFLFKNGGQRVVLLIDNHRVYCRDLLNRVVTSSIIDTITKLDPKATFHDYRRKPEVAAEVLNESINGFAPDRKLPTIEESIAWAYEAKAAEAVYTKELAGKRAGIFNFFSRNNETKQDLAPRSKIKPGSD